MGVVGKRGKEKDKQVRQRGQEVWTKAKAEGQEGQKGRQPGGEGTKRQKCKRRSRTNCTATKSGSKL